jgi:hypothetical protein
MKAGFYLKKFSSTNLLAENEENNEMPQSE